MAGWVVLLVLLERVVLDVVELPLTLRESILCHVLAVLCVVLRGVDKAYVERVEQLEPFGKPWKVLHKHGLVGYCVFLEGQTEWGGSLAGACEDVHPVMCVIAQRSEIIMNVVTGPALQGVVLATCDRPVRGKVHEDVLIDIW